MITHLHRLLEAITAQSDRPLVQLPWMSDAECQQILVDWNDTGHHITAATLPELFTAQVTRTPAATAVVADDVSLSYAELDARANRLAHRLVRLGVGPECPVGLLMERSVDVVVAELAIVKAGGAYVPVDVRARFPGCSCCLTETKASVLVTDRGWATPAQQIHEGHLVVVDADLSVLDEPADAPLTQAHPDNLVYVMYTSGSTGTPKGVAVRHRDVVALAFARCFAGGGHERVLLHSPQAFDASTYELWVPLLTGGQVVVAPPGDLTVEALRHVIINQGVTGLWLTAGPFRADRSGRPPALLGRSGCEVWTAATWPLPRRAPDSGACPGLVVVDGYGPTETTTFATLKSL